MKAAAAVLWVLVSTLAFGQAARITVPLPQSRLARDVAVLWHADNSVVRFTEPGTHEWQVPCGRVGGMKAPLKLEVERVPMAARDCSAAELAELCRAHSPEIVRFEDTVSSLEPLLGGGQDRLTLPDGTVVELSCVFRTAEGFLCLVPVDRPASAELCAGGGVGLRWSLMGKPLLLTDGSLGLMVLHAAYPGKAGEGDEDPWRVQMFWNGASVCNVDAPGAYPVELPCLFRPGAREWATLLLREYRQVHLEVGGHPVEAELAATPEARSWGLQGRRSVGENRGMIFYFPERLRPTFVMKTVSFPLSIAFITADGTIANIDGMDPGQPGGATAATDINYVLEMNRGWFKANGVEPGALVVIP